MDILNALLLVVGGILAVSGLIVAKQPNAKELIDKLVPYQAIIGVAMLAFGVVNLLAASILLGFLFGMPQLVKWMPGTGAAEQKGMALMNKLAPYQVILGIGGIGASLIYLAYRVGILNNIGY
jgi:hypothetical protein